MNIKIAAFTVSEKSIDRTFCFLFMENINDGIEFWVRFVRGKQVPSLYGATLIKCYLEDGLVA